MGIRKIITDQDIFKPGECKFINEIILGNNFPWCYNANSVIGKTFRDGIFYFSHQLLERPEQRPESSTNVFTTKRFYHAGVTEPWLKIAKRFIKKHKLPFKEFLRASLNMTLPQKISRCPEHQDHDFPHHLISFYLNTIDGDTVLLHKGIEHTRITPEAFKAISFSNYYSHYVIHPTRSNRVVMVVTFR